MSTYSDGTVNHPCPKCKSEEPRAIQVTPIPKADGTKQEYKRAACKCGHVEDL